MSYNARNIIVKKKIITNINSHKSRVYNISRYYTFITRHIIKQNYKLVIHAFPTLSERISDNKTKNILDTFNPVTILCSIKMKQF